MKKGLLFALVLWAAGPASGANLCYKKLSPPVMPVDTAWGDRYAAPDLDTGVFVMGQNCKGGSGFANCDKTMFVGVGLCSFGSQSFNAQTDLLASYSRPSSPQVGRCWCQIVYPVKGPAIDSGQDIKADAGYNTRCYWGGSCSAICNGRLAADAAFFAALFGL